MKLLFVLVQLRAALCVNKHEAKCTLQIVQHLLLFCWLPYFNWKLKTLFFCRGWDCF